MIQDAPGKHNSRLRAVPMSHLGTHSCTGGHCTGHGEFFCPFPTHSPTAEVCMQQVVPNQLHFSCPPFKRFLSHSSTNRMLRESQFQFPTRFVDLLFALYPPLTQFVNRLISLFCRLHFLHDGFPILHCPGCAVLLKVGL